MGDYDILVKGTKRTRAVATDTLDYLFNDGISQTHENVKNLRKVHSNFLKPGYVGDARVLRKESLRFAAFQLADGVTYRADKYPARKFQKFLKWLTWLAGETGGKLQVIPKKTGKVEDWVPPNGVPSTPSALILETLREALPDSGKPQKVKFKFDDKPLAVIVDKTADPWVITVYSKKDDPSVPGGSDSEDEF